MPRMEQPKGLGTQGGKIMEKLHNKEFSKILFDLNNRDTEIKVSEKQKKAYEAFNLSKEEIWAYDTGVLFLTLDDNKFSVIDMARNWTVGKRSFLLEVFSPIYQKFTERQEEPDVAALDQFILMNGLGKGIFENVIEKEKWLQFEPDAISEQDAYKLVKNLTSFMQKFNL